MGTPREDVGGVKALTIFQERANAHANEATRLVESALNSTQISEWMAPTIATAQVHATLSVAYAVRAQTAAQVGLAP